MKEAHIVKVALQLCNATRDVYLTVLCSCQDNNRQILLCDKILLIPSIVSAQNLLFMLFIINIFRMIWRIRI